MSPLLTLIQVCAISLQYIYFSFEEFWVGFNGNNKGIDKLLDCAIM